MSASEAVNSYLDLPSAGGTIGLLRPVNKTSVKALLKRKAHRRMRKLIKHCLKVLDDKQTRRGRRTSAWDVD